MAEEITKPTPDPTILTTQQLHEATDRVKELMDSELHSLERLFTEKLDSVDKQLILIERQRIELKVDTEKAVQAALSAAKEAVTKNETATTEQLKQLSTTFTTAIAGVTSNAADLKDRVGKIESVKQGVQESKTSFNTVAMAWIAGLGLLVSVLAIVIVVVLSNGAGP